MFYCDYEIKFSKKVFEPTLRICADILNLHLKERCNNYINEKDAELSGADTDTDGYISNPSFLFYFDTNVSILAVS